VRQGKIGEAIPHLEKAVEYQPEDAETQGNLGLALAMTAKFAEALPHFEKAVKLSNGRDPAMLDLLAGAYAEAGRFPEAIETARRALAIATEQRNYELVEALKASIARYESRTSR
jgi:Flp pilus assembly protein TadD